MTLRRLAIIMLFALAASCSSATSGISKAATRIADRSRQDIEAWHAVEADAPSLAPVAEAGIERAEATIADASGVQESLTRVRDAEPWWASVVRYALIAAAGVALAWLLTASGVLSAIRSMLGWIPRRKAAQAELAHRVLDESSPEEARELIAAMRAGDSEFDAAWRSAARPPRQTKPKVAAPKRRRRRT